MASEKKDKDIIIVPPSTEIAAVPSIITLPNKEELLKNDDIIKGIVEGSSTFELIDLVLAELAADCTHLKYERMKRDANNQDVDRVVLRHANILKMINDALIQKRTLALNDIINLRSPQWQLVFEELLKKMKQTLMDISLSSEQMELFFEKFNKNIEGFEEQTELKLKDTLTNAG